MAERDGAETEHDAPHGGEEEPSSEYRLRGQPRPAGRGRPAHKATGVDIRQFGPDKLFGRAVWFLRVGRGVKLIDLAATAGISIGQLSEVENATYDTWRSAADRIAQGLDFPTAMALLRAFYGNDLPQPDEPFGLPE